MAKQLWEMIKVGRPKIFDCEEDLWIACSEYFKWVDANPLIEKKLVSFRGESVLEDVPKLRAMTLGGLQLFLGIDNTTWMAYRSEGHEFSKIAQAVEKAIKEQKFAGAAAELFNSSIIARDLGLADNTNNTSEHAQPLQINFSVAEPVKDVKITRGE